MGRDLASADNSVGKIDAYNIYFPLRIYKLCIVLNEITALEPAQIFTAIFFSNIHNISFLEIAEKTLL